MGVPKEEFQRGRLGPGIYHLDVWALVSVFGGCLVTFSAETWQPLSGAASDLWLHSGSDVGVPFLQSLGSMCKTV